jgi:hypothetical protein
MAGSVENGVFRPFFVALQRLAANEPQVSCGMNATALMMFVGPS